MPRLAGVEVINIGAPLLELQFYMDSVVSLVFQAFSNRVRQRMYIVCTHDSFDAITNKCF